ncbi:serine hydrolase domain-containing protein [Salisediminibacterium beveridgei]|uniref:Penicillin-binding protein n=1 Tax=Salisediminibacterium beveridgei TaxID=632773 RepID=A0A1D7QZ52_9BACI|nr:serine hydrolase [Salisediminibacterium beveridgei]AOM84281.1 penicillin-binding protein [Salisediminibacterium beveridgei]
MKHQDVKKAIDQLQEDICFSGTFHAKSEEINLSGSYGYANKSEKIFNQINTRFGIASGCKIFTAVAICQLVEEGKLSFDTKLTDCLDFNFPHFDEEVTIHHLLTHTAGIPDYFDEDVMDDYEELWTSTPMYGIRNLQDFLPLFQYLPMKGEAGNAFSYNDAGYIVLGLVVEAVSGQVFGDYVEESIFRKVGMTNSGYFHMDELPERVALGYIEKPDGGWRTNIYAIPVKSASDGGAFVTATDMITFWDALMNDRLLSGNMKNTLLQPQEKVEDDLFYGYGGYMEVNQQEVVKHMLIGHDPGVNFRAVHYPKQKLTIAVCSNESNGAYEILKEIEGVLVKDNE